jgi:hypothetical protein
LLSLTSCARTHLPDTSHLASFQQATFFDLLARLSTYFAVQPGPDKRLHKIRSTVHQDGSHPIDGSNKFMSFASFGASNPEEYRLREDFVRYLHRGWLG